MPLKLILASLCLTVLLVLAAFVAAYLSLWHLWVLLPAGEIKVAVNRARPGSALLDPYLLSRYPNLSFLTQTSRYAISGLPGQLTVVALPQTLFSYRQINREVSNQGWQVNSHWPLVFASQGVSPAMPSKESLISAAKYHISQEVPTRPALLGFISDAQNPILDHELYIIAAEVASPASNPALGVEINSSRFHYQPSLIGGVNQNNNLHVALPSSVLDKIPQPLIAVYLEQLLDSLPFQRVKPDLLSALKQQDAFVLRKEQGVFALTVVGNPAAFRQQVKNWTIEEESYSRPEVETSLLPDLTLIKSYTARRNPDIFQISGHCEAASWLSPGSHIPGGELRSNEGTRSEIWLCQENDNRITLSSSQALAKSAAPLLDDPSNTWSANLDEEALGALQLSITGISGHGNDHGAFLIINLGNTAE